MLIVISARPTHTAWTEQVIKKCLPIKHKLGLSPWEQPTPCLHFELLTPAATSFICQSVRRCPRSVFSQRGIVDKPRRRVTGEVYGLWHCIKKQVQTKTLKIKVRDQPSVAVSPHSIYKIGSCALGVNVRAGAARHGSRLCVWRVRGRALDHAVKWKVLVHDHKPSRK